MTSGASEELQIADWFLGARIREGMGGRTAVLTEGGAWTYDDVDERASRFAHLLAGAGVAPENRVILALPDGIDFVAALFGVLRTGAVAVMLNPDLGRDRVAWFAGHTRARAAFVHTGNAAAFRAAAAGSRFLDTLLVVDEADFARRRDAAPATFETFPSHRDDAAIWLFSGGTTGRPKAVVQTHRSFVHTAECYGKGILGIDATDRTLSVPKLYFGYATGTNLLFPFAAGATSILFPERCTAGRLFDLIAKFRPTVLVNVPTMVGKLVDHPAAAAQDLSCLRLATSAGEALPVGLHERWNRTFGVDLLDGLGTAEMWHVFLSNRPGAVRPGTLGQVVPGFEVEVRGEDGAPLPDGETGWLWVKGGARAIGYWQQLDATARAFRGEWYVSGDLVTRDGDGYFTYRGRADDMLKVSGKWVATREVEECLASHPAVADAAVVGVAGGDGLIKPHAFVVARAPDPGLERTLQDWVKDRLEPYKYPRRVVFVDALPRTHLGKVDRGRLRRT